MSLSWCNFTPELLFSSRSQPFEDVIMPPRMILIHQNAFQNAHLSFEELQISPGTLILLQVSMARKSIKVVACFSSSVETFPVLS